MKPFSLLIKPASADCNLRCTYCFYRDRALLYPESSRHRMPPEVLEHMIRSYLATDQAQHVFGWQGGEPTLMGEDFFQAVTGLQQKYGRKGACVANGLQTNATLVTDAMARHFARYRFLLGVSLDGPPAIHDRYRCGDGGAGSYEAVMRGVECLRRHGVEFNILVLVSQANVRRAREIYRFLTRSGFMFHQYIPCVESAPDGSPLPYSINGEEWGLFLCELFDEWAGGDVRRVSIRLFDAILSRFVEGRATVCHMANDCRQYFVVEHNGDVYPCDFFVERDLKLGNILADDWDALQASPVYEEFGRRKARWPAVCSACAWVGLCAGDCPKHRLPGKEAALSRLCAGWQRFYAHAVPRLRPLADEIARERAAAPARPRPNDLCSCGSGRKYKKCCGSAARNIRIPPGRKVVDVQSAFG